MAAAVISPVSSWRAFEQEQPDLAREVRSRLDAHVHKVVATLRADGSPRLCGSEVVFHGEHLWLAGMTGARRFADLRRDPRVAVHSCPEDMPGWSGDARVSGTAVEVDDPEVRRSIQADAPPDAPQGPFELFRLDLTEAMAVRLDEGGEQIVVEWWREGAGLGRSTRS